MQILFSNRAYLSVISETSEKIKTETGGIFLGCYENGNWYVIEAIDPGPKSVFQAAYFEYDQKYTKHLINKIARLYQSKLTLVGLWHRHPGSFDTFSPTDDGTNSNYAKLTTYGAISVLVNIDPRFRITPYHVTYPLRYSRISYQVGDGYIPKHLLQLKNAEHLLGYINGYANRSYSDRGATAKSKEDFVCLLDGIRARFQPVLLSKEDFKPGEAEKYKDVLIDTLLDDITYFSETRGLVLNIEQNEGVLYLSHKGTDNTLTSICFTYIAHKRQVVFFYGDVCYLYHTRLFTNLLSDRNPQDTTVKSGLMINALAWIGLGKDNQGK